MYIYVYMYIYNPNGSDFFNSFVGFSFGHGVRISNGERHLTLAPSSTARASRPHFNQ